jgi:hypothetical protein
MAVNLKFCVSEKAYKLGSAHRHLRKVEKIFSELNVTSDKIESELLDLLEFCNARIKELRERE